MIELRHDQLHFRFPDVHKKAELRIEFERTLRVPDDGHHYPLPPGLGRFPLRQVDDFAPRVPADWLEHGGVMLPMYQSEALWIAFDADYPFAIRVAVGMVDALTGDQPYPGLHRKPQDYLVIPEQPWLDGYCASKGVVRQFVPVPLGTDPSAAVQTDDSGEHVGVQFTVHPMKTESYERIRMPELRDFLASPSAAPGSKTTGAFLKGMGLAPGVRTRQEIFHDPYHIEDWEMDTTARCFVHLANSAVWRHITGEAPPTVPPTAKEYAAAKLPWFGYYSDLEAIGGSAVVRRLRSVAQLATGKPPAGDLQAGAAPLGELRKGLGKHEVRVGRF